MNGHETANTDYGKTALPTGLGGCQAGFFPDYYSQPHDIKEQPLDLAQAIDWDFINDAVPGPKYVVDDACASFRSDC